MVRPVSVSRRSTLLAAGAAALTVASSSCMANQETKQGWIDAHSHIWSADTKKFPLASGQTAKDLDPPRFTYDDLMKLAEPEGVTRAVLIQHSVYHRFDNSTLLDAVERHPKRFRAVAMVDDTQPSPGRAMKSLLPKGVTGFRITPFIRKEKPSEWLESAGMSEMWAVAAETRQAMCCLINPDNLAAVEKMCGKYPDTPVVVDHFARIGADGVIREEDIAKLCRLAEYQRTAVKVSAFYALGKKQPPYTDLAPMINRLHECFGPERLMWASDCPYQLQKGNSYRASISLVRDQLDFLSAEDRQWILGGTAEKVFFYQ